MTALAPPPPPPPEGFEPFPSRSPYVNRAGTFYVREEPDGTRTVGTWVGPDQGNSEGFAHGGFLLTFADFALSLLSMGITLSMTTDFLRPAKMGDWLEARIIIRKASDTLIFADTIITAGGQDVLRAGGLFRPFEKRS